MGWPVLISGVHGLLIIARRIAHAQSCVSNYLRISLRIHPISGVICANSLRIRIGLAAA